MKSFYPAVITKNVDDAIYTMEQLGFLVAHKQEGVIENGYTEYILENAEGFKCGIISSDEPEDISAVYVGTDNIEDAVKEYSDMGFSVYKDIHSTEFSKTAIMKSGFGLFVMLSEHIK